MQRSWNRARLSISYRSYSSHPSLPLITIPGADIHPFGRATQSPVFRDVNWTVRDGESWAVVGSGSGKKAALFQTLLGHLRISPPPPPPAGLFPLLSQNNEDPYSKISIVSFGNVARSSGAFYDYTARYGAVRDQDKMTLRESVFPEMIDDAVGEFAYRQHERRQVDAAQMKHFETLAERMGLSKLLDLPMVALSNGQTRRARILKAVLGKPELLLLDEPLTGLDAQTRPSLLALLHELHSSKAPRIILGLRNQDSIPDWITDIAYVVDHSVYVRKRGERKPLLVSPHEDASDGESRRSVVTAGRKEVLVDMKNVGVQYKDRTVLQSTNWEIRAGERWHLVGSNGSGKTTLLSLITGDHPQSYTQSSPRHLHLFSLPRQRIATPTLQSKIGVVSPELFDAFPRRSGLKVWDVVVTGFDGVFSLPRDDVGKHCVGGRVGEEMSEEEIEWRVGRVWEMIYKLGPAGWGDGDFPREFEKDDMSWPQTTLFASRAFESLSVGEQRMVLLMRALVGKPKLVLLDEVWSGMDDRMIKTAREYLRNDVGDDQAVVVITHWENEVPWGVEEGLKKFVLENGKGRVV